MADISPTMGGLRRRLTVTDLLAYGLVFMVPVAPMAIFGAVFAASHGMVVLAYLVGAVTMGFTAVSYAQMVKAFPLAGSVYTYAGRGIAPSVGFLAGWAMLADYVAVPCLLAVVAAVSMHATVPLIPVWAWVLAFVGVNMVINVSGIRVTATATRLFLIAELIVLAVFLLVAGWVVWREGGNGWSWEPVFDPAAFSWPVVLAGVSVAMLSFLGFDAITLLAEEHDGAAKRVGWAMIAALGLAAVLFAAQTWLAALLIPDPGRLIADGDPSGTAFYQAAGTAVGWLSGMCAVATALAWGIANSLVAQTATSRLLFAMARDRQLPTLLAKVSIRRGVPVNAILTTAALSVGLGLYMAVRADGVVLLSSLVNFGALTGFVILHVNVVWHYLVRQRSRRWIPHLLVPVAGVGLLVAVAVHANVLAQRAGLLWIASGAVVLAGLWIAGMRPQLAGMPGTANPTTGAHHV
ncbi:APC family permease [Catenuloplanes japonicus]|uniref:APC family permease n=1 Tax=Catenuloplanes japonicus TaxID=33876 RepID=UPI00068D91ED|nr:APC family permease [Catenuloplanes japonicus]